MNSSITDRECGLCGALLYIDELQICDDCLFNESEYLEERKVIEKKYLEERERG